MVHLSLKGMLLHKLSRFTPTTAGFIILLSSSPMSYSNTVALGIFFRLAPRQVNFFFCTAFLLPLLLSDRAELVWFSISAISFQHVIFVLFLTCIFFVDVI